MKNLMLLALMMFSFQSFAAGPIENAVRGIEIENNAKCIQTTKTIFSKCVGFTMCFYNLKYRCDSNDGVFKLKVKVKEVSPYGKPLTLTVRETVITKYN